MDKDAALKAVVEELERATRLHPRSFNSAHEGFAVLKEEVDELWEEVKHGRDPADLRAEAVQVGAMALRFLMDLCGEAGK
jgi:NTP pyrophosphatase (non-canonical NTP hydrolase)